MAQVGLKGCNIVNNQIKLSHLYHRHTQNLFHIDSHGFLTDTLQFIFSCHSVIIRATTLYNIVQKHSKYTLKLCAYKINTYNSNDYVHCSKH